jgi:hypothetical protein
VLLTVIKVKLPAKSCENGEIICLTRRIFSVPRSLHPGPALICSKVAEPFPFHLRALGRADVLCTRLCNIPLEREIEVCRLLRSCGKLGAEL